MSGCCDCGSTAKKTDVSPRYRRILWAALVINMTMFGVECSSGWHAGSFFQAAYTSKKAKKYQ